MMRRHSTGFRLNKKVAATQVLSGEIVVEDVISGFNIGEIGLYSDFDRLVMIIGELMLSRAGLDHQQTRTALDTLYKPLTQKPTIEQRLNIVTNECAYADRFLVVVPPYQPPIISKAMGFISPVSFWALNATRPMNYDNPLEITGVACTIYQPKHTQTYLLKSLTGPEVFTGEQELLDRLGSVRGVKETS